MMIAQNGQARIDRYWNPVTAWYPRGKDDPKLALLCLDVSDPQVWISDADSIRFAFEIARANATGKAPDMGGARRLNLN